MSEIERAIEKKEYIERGAALELFWEYSGNWNLINAIPDADVEPVVRGEWQDGIDFDEQNVYMCSVCKEPYILECGTPKDNKYNYCPNCGAHMKMSEPKQPDRCTTCENNGKPICSNCIMTGYGNDIDFYHTAGEA